MSPALYFTAPALAVGSNYVNITFIAYDQLGASSAPFSIVVSVAPNNAPVATSASLSTTQESFSAPIALSGTDVDVADAGLLQIYITGLPIKGSLFMNSNNVSGVPTLVTGPVTYYTDQRGSDQFFFIAKDPLGLVSTTTLVPINITSINHPPSISFAGVVNVLETSNATIRLISASDPDGDMVTVYISALPTLGALYQVDGTRITTANTSITDALNRVVYVPDRELSDQVSSFSIYGNDGMGWLNSVTPVITAVLNIAHVNRPPIAFPDIAVKPFNPSNFSTTPNVTDLDTPLAQLAIVIQSIPDSTLGTLTDLLGMPVITGQIIPYPFGLMFLPNATGVGSSDFRFYATDGLDVSATTIYVIIINAAVNSAPIASASASYTAVHGEPLAISLSVHDDDFYEWFTFEISAYLSGPGLLTDVTSLVTFAPTFNVTMLQNPLLFVTSAIVMFTAPMGTAEQASYLTLNYTAYDTAMAASNMVTVVVDIAPNNIPVAFFNTTVVLLEEADSLVFTLTGFDDDILILFLFFLFPSLPLTLVDLHLNLFRYCR